jgi:hypothetical protein
LLAVEEYDVMLIPIILRSAAAGTLLNALIVQEKRWTWPTLEKRDKTYTVYTVYKTLCPNDKTWKDGSQLQKQGEE